MDVPDRAVIEFSGKSGFCPIIYVKGVKRLRDDTARYRKTEKNMIPMLARDMCRGILTTFILLKLLLSLPAQEHQNTFLFLSTAPLRASLSIGGEYRGASPLFLRDLSPGFYRLEAFKEGYRSEVVEFEIESGQVLSLHIDMEADAPGQVLSTGGAVSYQQREIGRGGDFLIPHGFYDVAVDENRFRFEPVFPEEDTLRVLNVSLPALITVSALLTLTDFVYPKRSGLFFSPVTLAAYSASLGVLSYKIVLDVRKSRYLRSAPRAPSAVDREKRDPEVWYQVAQELLTRDELDKALEYYTAILEEDRDSPLYPQALYKVGKIHFIKGEYDLARSIFELIVERYPLIDLYDKSLRSLADTDYRQMHYTESLAALDRMVFVDPLYSRAEVERFKQKIMEKMAEE
jgi:tetratricopeptide (TPR) repeat protein